MNGGASSGFARAIELLSFISAVAASFAWLPDVYEKTRSWVIPHIINGFGTQHLDWLLIAWKAVLALLIYAAVRSLLGLVLSAAGLAIALRILSIFRKD